MVIGEKNVGKSTFVQYLLNSLLGELEKKTPHPLELLVPNTSKRIKDSTVFCLDLDPGQPLQSTPGILSLQPHKIPCIGHVYTYSQPKVKSSKELAREAELLAEKRKMVDQFKRLQLRIKNLQPATKSAKPLKRIDVKKRNPQLKAARAVTGPAYRTILEKLEGLKCEDIYCNSEVGHQYLLGNVSTNNCYVNYLKIAQKLMDDYSRQHKDKPLVVNTMGWLKDLGLDILIELIKIVKPTHVVHLCTQKDMKQACSYSYESLAEYMGSRNFFPILPNRDPTRRNKTNGFQFYEYWYIYPRINETSLPSAIYPNPKPYELRSLMMLSYFSSLWQHDAKTIDLAHCKSPVILDCTKTAFYDLSTGRSASAPSEPVNELYALCHVNPDNIVETGKNMPRMFVEYRQRCSTIRMQTSNDSAYSKLMSPDLFIFKGWGIIVGGDEEKHKLQLMTPRGEKGLDGVNILVKCNVDFPDMLQKFCFIDT